jgi:predicted DCC family thiol-disulfide oxidoreductase YuxK
MRNGWTGGQYSIYRVVCGLYLLFSFVILTLPAREIFGGTPSREASPIRFLNVLTLADVATPLAVVAAIASLFFMAGYCDRIAAMVMWYALLCLPWSNAAIAGPLPFGGWPLLAHVLLPPAPWGSLAAKGRTDPRGGWSMPAPIFAAAWIVTSAGYAYSGYTHLVGRSWVGGAGLAAPLSVITCAVLVVELLYAPLAFFRLTRPWIWLTMLLVQLGSMALLDFADLRLGMVVLHFFTFDPAWVGQKRAGAADVVFYDGTCGLCHGGMRWLAAEDPTGSTFVFAPIGGERFAQEIPDASSLPDSVIVKTAEGDLLVRSAAALRMLHRLGGLWRVFAFLLQPLPKRLLDRGYDFIASIRYRIFGRTKEACPLVPPDLRSRFSA